MVSDEVYANIVEDESYVEGDTAEEREIYLKGLKLFAKHLEYYKEIATRTLGQLGIVPEFEVVEYRKRGIN